MASLAAHRDARARGRRDGAPQRARGRREVAHRRDPRHRSLARAVWLPGVRRVLVHRAPHAVAWLGLGLGLGLGLD